MSLVKGFIGSAAILFASTAPDAQWNGSGNKLHTTGRVGIGTDDPAQKLDVDGNINVTGWIGTSDNTPLRLFCNKARVFQATPGQDEKNHFVSPNLIGGHESNSVPDGVAGATIAGGTSNSATNSFVTVGGGRENTASGMFATVGGGTANKTKGEQATVAGGGANTASSFSTVAGGFANSASGQYSTIGGGQANLAPGAVSVVPGGANNAAAGKYSFAAGQHANASHDGAFVWGDSSTNTGINSTAVNQFIVRAKGGIWFGSNSEASVPAGRFINTSTGAHLTTGGAWTNNSDRDTKDRVADVDARGILDRLCALPITTWQYRAEQPEIRHIGPMAQDFAAAFNLGGDEQSISTIDADGVALASIQALRQLMDEKEGQITALQSANQLQQKLIDQLLARVEKLESSTANSAISKGEQP